MNRDCIDNEYKMRHLCILHGTAIHAGFVRTCIAQRLNTLLYFGFPTVCVSVSVCVLAWVRVFMTLYAYVRGRVCL